MHAPGAGEARPSAQSASRRENPVHHPITRKLFWTYLEETSDVGFIWTKITMISFAV